MSINIKQFIMGILPASYFLWTDQFTGACIILFLLIILDTITGMRAAKKLKIFSSTIAVQRTTEKAKNYLTILIVGYLVNVFFINISIDGYVAEFLIAMIGGFLHYAFILFAGFLIGVEGYSILENLAKMGQKLPKKIIEEWSKNIK
ncbi:MAG: phage holin family protein [Syntrophomonadales bacterium]